MSTEPESLEEVRGYLKKARSHEKVLEAKLSHQLNRYQSLQAEFAQFKEQQRNREADMERLQNSYKQQIERKRRQNDLILKQLSNIENRYLALTEEVKDHSIVASTEEIKVLNQRTERLEMENEDLEHALNEVADENQMLLDEVHLLRKELEQVNHEKELLRETKESEGC